LDVDLGRSERRLRLLQGEGYFQVAPDPARPFRVGTAHGTVTALGTAFDVRIGDASTQVAVTEHSVAVDAAGQAPVAVAKGSRCRSTITRGTGVDRRHRRHHGVAARSAGVPRTAFGRGGGRTQPAPRGPHLDIRPFHRGPSGQRRVSRRRRLGSLAAIESALQLRSTRLSGYFVLLHR
uniref:FecR family protein n=1 Tax=Methylogaea oryzae TaxID=1295382 RepID=UPI001C3F19F1